MPATQGPRLPRSARPPPASFQVAPLASSPRARGLPGAPGDHTGGVDEADALRAIRPRTSGRAVVLIPSKVDSLTLGVPSPNALSGAGRVRPRRTRVRADARPRVLGVATKHRAPRQVVTALAETPIASARPPGLVPTLAVRGVGPPPRPSAATALPTPAPPPEARLMAKGQAPPSAAVGLVARHPPLRPMAKAAAAAFGCGVAVLLGPPGPLGPPRQEMRPGVPSDFGRS